MKLFVTGATGFLGQYVVGEALAAGLQVRAVARAGADIAALGWTPGANLEIARLDLRSSRGLADALSGCDAVLHLAAAKSGDFYAQMGGTVVATENLLSAMQQADVRHIVSISSFAVYSYLHRWSHARLDEQSPVDEPMVGRDDYAQTKLIQERLVIGAAEKNNWTYTILRPGMIYGRDNLFNARVGMQAGRKYWIRTGAWARIPLTYVENCAQAIVLACTSPAAAGQVINIVDDRPPTQRHYAKMLQQRTTPRPRIIPVSWTIMRLLARSAWLTNKLLLGNRAKVPGILIPARLHARCKPLRYDNRKARSLLNWKARYSLEEALDRSIKPAPQRLSPMPATTALKAAS